jgi:hypothetical protein
MVMTKYSQTEVADETRAVQQLNRRADEDRAGSDAVKVN